jgi:hypothetical protein
MKDYRFIANGANSQIRQIKNKNIRGIRSFALFALKILILTLLLASCNLSSASEMSVASETPIPSSTASWQIGDLGWGKVTGHVNDAITGEPIPGALVTCDGFSYTSPATCQGSTTTDFNGDFVFENVFFHDTDRITIRIEALNYVSQTFAQEFFTQPEFYVNIPLMRADVTPPSPCCTPPACSANETYYCPGKCPCGCGTTCATKTITPTPLSFACVDCALGSALEAVCPLASGDELFRDVLAAYGEVQRAVVNDHACLYASTFDGNWGYLYYLDEATSTVQFVVINPYLLTPSPTGDPYSPIPSTPPPDVALSATPTWTPTP